MPSGRARGENAATEIDARLIERPTPLPNGVAAWVTTFRRGWLDRAGVPEEERAEIGEAVAQTLLLALDPYPRSPAAEAALREAGVKSEEEASVEASPFAALKGLKGGE